MLHLNSHAQKLPKIYLELVLRDLAFKVNPIWFPKQLIFPFAKTILIPAMTGLFKKHADKIKTLKKFF